MANFELRLFRSFEVQKSGKIVDNFKSNKARALLAYLAVESDHPPARNYLAGFLWPDWPQQSAMSNLRYALADLRKAIGDRESQKPLLLISHDRLRFSSEADCWVDVLELEKRIDAAILSPGSELDIQRLIEAVDWYRGEFLAEFRISDSPPFEEWVLGKREFYRQQMIRALEILTERAEWQNDYLTGLNYAQRQLEIEPWHEPAYRAMMRLQTLNGQRSKALRYYLDLQELLRSELRVDPDPQTTSLFQEIQSGKFPGAGYPGNAHLAGVLSPSLLKSFDEKPAVPKSNLPNLAAPFFNRETDLMQLEEALKSHHLITLTGHSGVGKSHLAIELARRIGHQFPQGTWYFDIGSLPGDAQIPLSIVTALGFSIDGVDSFLTVFQEYLKSRRILIIFDNCEMHINACEELLHHLIVDCPDLTIIVTSHEKLGISGEAVIRVRPFDTPAENEIDPEKIMASSSVIFLSDCIRRTIPEYAFPPSSLPWIAKICWQLGGLPLAIELIASWLPVLSPREVYGHLEELNRLPVPGLNVSRSHHQTLNTTLDWSYRFLSTNEQKLIKQLSVFTNGWTLEMAEFVCAGNGVEKEEILGLLSSLVNRSLVLAVFKEMAATRYMMPGRIRKYCQSLLVDPVEENSIRSRQLDYFYLTHLADKAQICAEEIGNLISAIEWSFQNDDTVYKGLELLVINRDFWLRRSFDGLHLLSKGLSLVKKGIDVPGVLFARALRLAGQLAGGSHNTQAVEWYKDSLRTYVNLSPAYYDERAGVMIDLANFVHNEYADVAVSNEYLDEVKFIIQEYCPAELELQADYYLSRYHIAIDSQDYDNAYAYARYWEKLQRELKNASGVIWSRVLYSECAIRHHGDFSTARTLLEEALNYFQVDMFIFEILLLLAYDYQLGGDHEFALETLSRCLEIARDNWDETGNLQRIQRTLFLYGMVQALEGNSLTGKLQRECLMRTAIAVGGVQAINLITGRKRLWRNKQDEEMLFSIIDAHLDESGFQDAILIGQGMQIRDIILFIEKGTKVAL